MSGAITAGRLLAMLNAELDQVDSYARELRAPAAERAWMLAAVGSSSFPMKERF